MPFVINPLHHPFPDYSCCYCSSVGPLIYSTKRKLIVCDYCLATYRGLDENGTLPELISLLEEIDTCETTWQEPGYQLAEGSSVLVFDNFTGEDNDLIAAHTPNTAPVGWAYLDQLVIGQDWIIFDNECQAIQLADGQRHFQVGDSGVADNIRIQVDFTRPDTADEGMGIAFRLDATGLPGSWTYFKAIWMADNEDVFILDPTNTELTDDQLAFDNGDTGRITVELVADDITAIFENLTQSTSSTLLATTSDNQTETHHGMVAQVPVGGSSSLYRFDNFRIEIL